MGKKETEEERLIRDEYLKRKEYLKEQRKDYSGSKKFWLHQKKIEEKHKLWEKARDKLPADERYLQYLDIPGKKDSKIMEEIEIEEWKEKPFLEKMKLKLLELFGGIVILIFILICIAAFLFITIPMVIHKHL
jgi:hypothetical protein|tara:strand:- start:36 stop:434 length:399 start_codon:yes stop_codon:yes gene_type:complete